MMLWVGRAVAVPWIQHVLGAASFQSIDATMVWKKGIGEILPIPFVTMFYLFLGANLAIHLIDGSAITGSSSVTPCSRHYQ